MKKRRSLWIIALLILLFCNAGYAQDSGDLYHRGVEAAKTKDLDSAFMYFQLLLSSSPGSKYKQEALFATGEYYFDIGNYSDASDAFVKLISDYPDSKGKLFAIAYLLKIAQSQENEAWVKSLQNKIVTFKQVILLFKNSKEYKYKSPFGKKYKVIYYIDNVQFYLDGELFAQIPY